MFVGTVRPSNGNELFIEFIVRKKQMRMYIMNCKNLALTLNL